MAPCVGFSSASSSLDSDSNNKDKNANGTIHSIRIIPQLNRTAEFELCRSSDVVHLRVFSNLLFLRISIHVLAYERQTIHDFERHTSTLQKLSSFGSTASSFHLVCCFGLAMRGESISTSKPSVANAIQSYLFWPSLYCCGAGWALPLLPRGVFGPFEPVSGCFSVSKSEINQESRRTLIPFLHIFLRIRLRNLLAFLCLGKWLRSLQLLLLFLLL